MAASRYAESEDLLARARRVVPGGVYGHQSPRMVVGGAYPYFFARGEGCRVWDVDGNEFIDLMCSYGPIVLGHRHPKVEEAARSQMADGDCFNAPSRRWVELAERLVAITPFADWAAFAKNGSDVCTWAVEVAREQTGRPLGGESRGRLPRGARLVHAGARRRHARRHRQRTHVHLQRSRQRPPRRRCASRRARRDHRLAVPSRRLPRSGAAGRRLPPGYPCPVRRRRRRHDPRRRARRLPPPSRRFRRALRRAPGPRLLREGAGQRLPARRLRRPRGAEGRGRARLFHRLVLHERRADGCRPRLPRRARGQRRHRPHGGDGRSPAARHAGAGGDARPADHLLRPAGAAVHDLRRRRQVRPQPRLRGDLRRGRCLPDTVPQLVRVGRASGDATSTRSSTSPTARSPPSAERPPDAPRSSHARSALREVRPCRRDHAQPPGADERDQLRDARGPARRPGRRRSRHRGARHHHHRRGPRLLQRPRHQGRHGRPGYRRRRRAGAGRRRGALRDARRCLRSCCTRSTPRCSARSTARPPATVSISRSAATCG